MERKKLSLEEIQALRAKAEKERAMHAETLKNIDAVTMSPQLQMSTLMSSYNRGRKDEILLLLAAHTSGRRQYDLSSEVMLFIYEHGDELTEAKNFMLQNVHLVYELEKRIFDDKLPPFFETEKGISYPKFYPGTEVYMVQETLKACQKALKITDELDFLIRYTKNHVLSHQAETALMDFLFVSTGRDSVLDALQAVVLVYLTDYQELSVEAQLRLIQSGDHKVIMYYITHSRQCINDDKVIKALWDRADAEEVTAYYDRWAWAREN